MVFIFFFFLFFHLLLYLCCYCLGTICQNPSSCRFVPMFSSEFYSFSIYFFSLSLSLSLLLGYSSLNNFLSTYFSISVNIVIFTAASTIRNHAIHYQCAYSPSYLVVVNFWPLEFNLPKCCVTLELIVLALFRCSINNTLMHSKQ